jgi:hypothetical protein
VPPSRDIGRLIHELSSPDALRRESAAARLAIAGPPAAARLAALAASADAPPAARSAALRTLASVSVTRATQSAIRLLGDQHDEVALEAIEVLRDAVRREDGTATEAFERLTALALAPDADIERRLAAAAALDGLPERLLRPIYGALAHDPSSRVVARVVRRQAGVDHALADLVEGPIAVPPGVLSAIVRDEAAAAGIVVLHKAIERVRAREAETGAADERAAWTAVRGQLHQALGDRGSRVALYDVRETLVRTGAAPLPVGFLSAAAAVGDAETMDAVAAAWLAAAAGDRWWREHLATVFAAIVEREGMTRSDPRLTRLLARAPQASPLVASAPRRPSGRRHVRRRDPRG